MITGYVLNHFLNTQIGGLLALPLIERFDGLLAPINLYWINWDGSLAWYNLLLIIIYLAVIALGLAAAWGRLHWIGLTPLVFGIGYALSNGIARFSSWRYNLPADWTAYFYFGIGAIEVLLQAFQLFGANRSTMYFAQQQVWRQQPRVTAHLFLASAFILVGALPWMAEGMASPRYTDQSAVTLEQKVMALPNSPSQAEIEAFVARPESFFEVGRLLYPRFLLRDKGLISTNPWPAYQLRDFPRFGFMLLNDKITSAVFPSKEGALQFPHAADVIVLGCMHDDYVNVRLVAFPALKVIHMSAPLTESCSP
jgi:hypothetical protein